MNRTAILVTLLALTTSHAAVFSSPGHQSIAANCDTAGPWGGSSGEAGHD